MSTVVNIPLTESGIKGFIERLTGYKKSLARAADELARRLAEIGEEDAAIHFADTEYVGDNWYTVTTEKLGDGRYAVVADGEAVLFIEFGAGVTYGYGHPEAGQNGMGPGTYPGSGHWDDPDGWRLPKAVQEQYGVERDDGNPPYAPMYNAMRNLEQDFDRIVQEVFAND